ncbi:hypothetical protein BpHYR1_037135 [Brachionus plicatilis]|uniref:Uncharacterized protein n=1 Tax=Brachionus plicatilis TaxID=10195 RepID=A0A3M7T214_BRAPC|nr:hypothetical protein BpHYR1_037135 [Brachionus plicatilis]
MDSDEDSNVWADLQKATKKFTKSCDQIKLLKQRIAELIKMFSFTENLDALSLTSERASFNKNLFNETIRQQIENLQSIRTAYIMYARKKADEITKLQCDLYGEDAVQEAYAMARNNDERSSQGMLGGDSEQRERSDGELSDSDDEIGYAVQAEPEDSITRRSSVNNDHDYLIA